MRELLDIENSSSYDIPPHGVTYVWPKRLAGEDGGAVHEVSSGSMQWWAGAGFSYPISITDSRSFYGFFGSYAYYGIFGYGGGFFGYGDYYIDGIYGPYYDTYGYAADRSLFSGTNGPGISSLNMGVNGSSVIPAKGKGQVTTGWPAVARIASHCEVRAGQGVGWSIYEPYSLSPSTHTGLMAVAVNNKDKVALIEPMHQRLDRMAVIHSSQSPSRTWNARLKGAALRLPETRAAVGCDVVRVVHPEIDAANQGHAIVVKANGIYEIGATVVELQGKNDNNGIYRAGNHRLRLVFGHQGGDVVHEATVINGNNVILYDFPLNANSMVPNVNAVRDKFEVSPSSYDVRNPITALPPSTRTAMSVSRRRVMYLPKGSAVYLTCSVFDYSGSDGFRINVDDSHAQSLSLHQIQNTQRRIW